jgi:hypothetical protein
MTKHESSTTQQRPCASGKWYHEMNRTEEYKALVEVTNAVDYSDKRTVRRSNNAVKRMYQLVRSAEHDGPGAIRELAQLLDDPGAACWLAHQLVECATLPSAVEDRCFAIVEKLAKDEGPEGLGEQWWLDEWRAKKGRT